MNGQDTELEKLLREKSDATMRYVAARIEKMDYSGGGTEAEPGLAEDGELDARLLQFAGEQDEVLRRAKSVRRSKRLLRYCAVFAVCFMVMGTLSVTAVDAWRMKFRGLSMLEKEQSTLVQAERTETEFGTIMLAAGYVPEGYEVLHEEERNKACMQVIYGNENECYLYFTQANPDNYTMNLDNEHTVRTDVTVRGAEGQLFVHDSGGSNTLVWVEYDMLVQLMALGEGCMSGEELLEFAESMILLK